MKQPDKELIEEIKDLFEDYEEAYVPGEWENFSKSGKKKSFVVPLWLKVAAVILLMLSVVTYSYKSLVKKDQLAVIMPAKSNVDSLKKQLPVLPPTDVFSEKAAASHKNTVLAKVASGNTTSKKAVAGIFDAEHKQILAVDDRLTAAAEKIQEPAAGVPERKEQLTAGITEPKVKSAFEDSKTQGNFVTPNKKEYPVVVQTETVRQSAIARTDSIKKKSPQKMSLMEFLIAEARKPAAAKNKEMGSKWDFGLEVAPTATGSNINVGAGLTTAYRLSDKFSLSSGISLMQLDAGKKYSPSPQSGNISSFASFADKEATGVDANIKAIDIPVALVYNISKNFYTSAGISYFNIISEKRSNTFVETSQQSVSHFDPQTGAPYSTVKLTSKEVEEPTPDSPLKGNSYLGFFNFSIGRRQTLFNKYNILIEPFIKVPVGKLSDQDLKLMNSGVKFQFAF